MGWGVRVQGLSFEVQGSEQGPGVRFGTVCTSTSFVGFEFRVSGSRFRASCFVFRVSGFGFRVSGFGVRV